MIPRTVAARALIAIVMLAGQAVPAAAQPTGLTASASIDRPAMWVADRVTYTVDIACPPGFDILTEDLARDKLKLTGLEVVSSDSTRQDDSDGRRYAFRYVLTTFKVDVPTPGVAAFPVRYYVARAGQRPKEAAPAGSILVPGVVIAFRSLLPDDQPLYSARDDRPVPPRWTPYRMLGAVGLGLIIAAIVPVAFLFISVARRARERRHAVPHPSARQVRQATRAALDEIRTLDAAADDARRAAFARLDTVVRHHVEDICGTPAAGLTPDEIARALESCGGRLPVEVVTSILASCELARYAPPDLQPSADAWRTALGAAEQLLGTRR